MPRLWTDTIEAHRQEVREAIMDTAETLATQHGPLSVTMSQVAQETGIGRATLYKYFRDVESILHAGHERHVAGHLAHLAELRDQDAPPAKRLDDVLQAYSRICHFRERHGSPELGALLHRGDQMAEAEQQLHDLFRDLVADAAASGDVRDDTAPDELATYCLHALAAAGSLPSEASVGRLAAITLDALRRPS